MSRSPTLLRKMIFSICMTPSLASRHVLSVSACCASCRAKSGARSGNVPCPGARGGDCDGGVWLSRDADASNTATTAASDALMPRILHRPRGIGGALVRAREPLAQLPRRVDRRRAVERHQRRRSTGQADDVRAPAILLDRRDLDQIWTSPDGLFKAMDDGVHGVGETGLGGASRIVRTPAQQTSEAKDENASTLPGGIVSRRQPAPKFFFALRCYTGNPPIMHRFC